MNDTLPPESDLAEWLGMAARTLAAVALAALLLAGGGGGTVRGVFQAAAASALVAAVAAQSAGGRWRLPRPTLLLVPTAAVLLGLLHAYPALRGGWSVSPLLATAGAEHSAAIDGARTMQWTLVFAGAGVLAFALAATLHGRLAWERWLLGMGAAVVLVGLLGTVQQASGRTQFLGVVSTANLDLPAFWRESFAAATSLRGDEPLAWQADRGTPESATFYLPPGGDAALFGTFLRPAHWVALMVTLLPALLVAAAAEGRAAWATPPLLLGVALAVWHGDTLCTTLALAVGAMPLALGRWGDPRRLALTLCALVAATLAAGAKWLLTTADQNALPLAETAAAALRLMWDHPLGSGWGTFRYLAPHYRLSGVGGLWVWLVEAGPFAAVAVSGFVLSYRPWRATAPLPVACGLGLLASLVAGAGVPGIDLPIAVAVAGVLLAGATGRPVAEAVPQPRVVGLPARGVAA